MIGGNCGIVKLMTICDIFLFSTALMWSKCFKYGYLSALCAVFTSRYHYVYDRWIIMWERGREVERAREWAMREINTQIRKESERERDLYGGTDRNRTLALESCVVSLKASLRPFHHIWYVRVVIRVARLYCFACKVRFRLCGKKEPQLTNFFSSILWILTTFQPARGHTNCCNDDNSRTTSWNRHYLRTKSPNWTVSVTTGGNNGNSGYLRWNRAVFKGQESSVFLFVWSFYGCDQCVLCTSVKSLMAYRSSSLCLNFLW